MKSTKKILAMVLFFALIMANGLISLAAETLTANPTASKVLVNGVEINFEAYTINGNNYFKLRDLAAAVSGTNKQFEIGYDNATKSITLASGKEYTLLGGEFTEGDGKVKSAAPTASKIYKDGKELNFTVYTIGGSNFFKLRDLMSVFDISVTFNDATKNIIIDTEKSYTPETVNQPTPAKIKEGFYVPAKDDMGGMEFIVRGNAMFIGDGFGTYTLDGDKILFRGNNGGESVFRFSGDSIFMEEDVWDDSGDNLITIEIEYVWNSDGKGVYWQ